MILAPTSYTQVTEAAREVVQAGIPLILVDSTLDERLEKSLIATDNLEAGRRMAECIKPFLPESPVIGIVAHVQGSSTAMEREQDCARDWPAMRTASSGRSLQIPTISRAMM